MLGGADEDYTKGGVYFIDNTLPLDIDPQISLAVDF